MLAGLVRHDCRYTSATNTYNMHACFLKLDLARGISFGYLVCVSSLAHATELIVVMGLRSKAPSESSRPGGCAGRLVGVSYVDILGDSFFYIQSIRVLLVLSVF